MLYWKNNNTILDILLLIAKQRPDDTAITHLDTVTDSITYLELVTRSKAIAAYLQKVGANGQRVIIAYPSSIEYVCAFFGCLFAGAIAVPVYPPKKNKEDMRFDSILRDSAATHILTSETIYSDLILCQSKYATEPGLTWITTNSTSLELASEWTPYSPSPKDLCFLQYTSGSTSSPKGIMVSHANIVTNTKMIANTFHMPPTGTIVSWLPHFHDMGLI